MKDEQAMELSEKAGREFIAQLDRIMESNPGLNREQRVCLIATALTGPIVHFSQKDEVLMRIATSALQLASTLGIESFDFH